jgi:RimJ/RimL family protein N-acetyltransferase
MILPTKEAWDIDKYALLLKDEKNEKGGLKMVGFVGTNRWCEKGMEVGYCSNVEYWGTGYTTEGFKAFLELYWTLPGTSISFPFPSFMSVISTRGKN